MRCWDSGDAPLAHTMLSTWELLRLSLSPPDREPTVGWWDSVLDLTQGIHLIYFIQFLVANSNSSFYWRWSLTHSLTQSRHTSKVERYRGSERFSKDERFLMMMMTTNCDHCDFCDHPTAMTSVTSVTTATSVTSLPLWLLWLLWPLWLLWVYSGTCAFLLLPF